MEQAIYFTAAVVFNLPFGMYRARLRKLSTGWFVAIHLPIPFIFLLRLGLGVSPWWIPLGLTGAVIGQVVGARLAPASWRAIGDRLNAEREAAKSAAAAQNA
jgi:hypothetical protein